jgi:hypothetical protein
VDWTETEAGSVPRLPDELRYDYAGRCWWCGAPADSREHKWKRTDVVRMYGSGPYGGELVWGDDDGRGRELQGARSPELKYLPNLCQRCNNARSQPFDTAYDVWAAYLFAHLNAIRDWTEFDLARVYRTDREAKRTNLARYFVKQIGCQLAQAGVHVPGEFIAFLDGGERPRCLRAGFAVSDGTLALQDYLHRQGVEPTGGLFLRGVECDYRPSANAIAETYGGFGISYVEVLWAVKHLDEPESGWGSCFGTDRQRITRGYEANPDEVLRQLEAQEADD